MSDLDEIFAGTPASDETTEAPQAAETAQPETVEQAAAPAAQEVTDDQTAAPSAATPEEPVEIKGLRAALTAERQKRQQYEQAIREWQEQQQAAQAKQAETKPEQTGAPNRANYQDDSAYWEAVIDYRAEQAADRKLLAAEAKRAEESQRQKAAADMRELQQAADNVVFKGQSKYTDFDAKINQGLAPFLNAQMHEALILADGSEDVAYHLATNPADAARIAQLKPLQMAVEIGRISARLSAQSSAPSRPQIPQTLTTTRNERGQFQPVYAGPTPLDDIFRQR
jgi:hypothetical protein